LSSKSRFSTYATLKLTEAQSQGASGFAMLTDEMLAACNGSSGSGQQAPTRTRMVKAENDA